MPKAVQARINEFIDYFNNHKIRAQQNKVLPSGEAPQVIFDNPADFGLENLKVDVTQEAIDIMRAQIATPREEAFCWVTDEFDALAFRVYQDIGAPSLVITDAWQIFLLMVDKIQAIYDA